MIKRSIVYGATRRPLRRLRSFFVDVVLRRCVTEAATRPRSSGQGESQSSDPYASSPWRRSLASAQTLSLFSTSPSALLFSLDQSLQGALAAVAKTKFNKDEHLLVFAVDKTLPSDILAETTRLLRDVPLAHVGVLSDPLPANWLPRAGLPNSHGRDGPQASAQRYHSVSLSLMPTSLAKPFHSSIPGSPEIKAGRWATGKPSFDESDSRVEQLGKSHISKGSDSTRSEVGWMQVWGKESTSRAVPSIFQDISNDSHLLTILLASDKSPQGLLEGLDAKYGSGQGGPSSSSPLIGSYATNTYFETGGRDRCMFIRHLSQEKDGLIVESGAVGLVMSLPQTAKRASTFVHGRPHLHMTLPWYDLVPLGPRREITRAKGNIISALQGSNACKWFLCDVASRIKAGRSSETILAAQATVDSQATRKSMDAATQRLLSVSVDKEEEFWAAVWQTDAQGEARQQEPPVLLARILSGHPGRGTISLETDLNLAMTELTQTLATPASPNSKLYLSFFQHVPGLGRRTEAVALEADEEAIIELPGSDLGAWALPRFLFVNTPEPVAAVNQGAKPSPEFMSAKKPKSQVHTLPNLFVLPSSGGGLLQRQSIGGADAQALRSKTTTWRLPGSRLLVDLRGK